MRPAAPTASAAASSAADRRSAGRRIAAERLGGHAGRVGEVDGVHRHGRVERRLRARRDARRAGGDERERRARRGRDDGEAVAPRRRARPPPCGRVHAVGPGARRTAAGEPTSRAGLQQRERDRVVAELGGERLDREAQRGAAQVRRRTPGARRARGRPGTARPRRAPPRRRRRARRTRPAATARAPRRRVRRSRRPSRASSVSTDSLSQVCSSVSSRSMRYSWGSARMRSAMMLRWICCVPP